MKRRNFNTQYAKSFTAVQRRTLSVFSNFSKNPIKFHRIEKTHLLVMGAIVLSTAGFLAGRFLAPQNSFGTLSSDDRTEAPKPIATQSINKQFEFPLNDENGKEVARIAYTVETANLQDAFIYQGKIAKAVKGRTFLIFNLKINNPYTKTVEINAKDYIRIRVNNSKEQLAPEIHNDPVQIQAHSTKTTRIGLPINDTDKNIVLLVGELNGDKQTVNLNISR